MAKHCTYKCSFEPIATCWHRIVFHLDLKMSTGLKGTLYKPFDNVRIYIYIYLTQSAQKPDIPSCCWNPVYAKNKLGLVCGPII